MNVTVAAPGKLVWTGEYAVLDGAPAVVCAVNRYARVSVKQSRRFTITGSHAPASRLEFELAADQVRWLARPAGWHLVATLVEHAAALWLSDAAPFEAHIDSSELFAAKHKLGLGSSAAVTVALWRALRQAAGRNAPPDLTEVMAMHRRVQGSGSGVDVAAALTGGLLRFQREAGGEQARVTPLVLPDGLFWRAMYSGRPASTATMLARLAEWRKQEPARSDAHLGRLGALADTAASALAAADAKAFLEAAGDYQRALAALGLSAGMPIFSAEHQQLAGLARECDVVYKSSGAGDGDLGIGFADDADKLAAFVRDAREQGFQAVDLGMAPAAAEGATG